MIDGIRRRFAKSVEKDAWDADKAFSPDVEEASEFPTDTTALLAARATAEFASNDAGCTDYYKNLVKTAIENGGKYGDHRISLPWLRMILAGLDSKNVEPEMMWYGMEESSPSEEPLPQIPAYNDLFPSERDVPTGPGPR